MNRQVCIVVPLLLLAVSLGCTRLWTKRFVIDEQQPAPTVRNWIIEPRLQAFDHVASDTALVDANDFRLDLHFQDFLAKKGSVPWDIGVDTARIRFLPSGEERTLWGRFVCYLSHPEMDCVEKAYSFRGLDFVGDPEWESDSFEIPKGIDSVLVELTAFLRPGALTSQSEDGYSLQWDFIEVDESAPVDTVVTSFKMYRSVTSQKTWKLFNDANNKD